MSVSTQSAHPWRATVRTAFAAVVGFLALLPLVATDVFQGGNVPAVVVTVLGVAAAVTRVLANPAVEGFLRVYVPFLSAKPAEVEVPDLDDDEF